MVCTRAPHPSRPGARRSAIWTVKARRNAISGLGRQLKQDGIEIVTLESTSDYWRIWFFVLEACGLAVQLVNASQAKSLPGRPKTDKLDAQWLARLTEMGLLRASFVPPRAIRANFRPSASATLRPREVLPTPGGPTRQRMGPLICLRRLRTARNSSSRSFTLVNP